MANLPTSNYLLETVIYYKEYFTEEMGSWSVFPSEA